MEHNFYSVEKIHFDELSIKDFLIFLEDILKNNSDQENINSLKEILEQNHFFESKNKNGKIIFGLVNYSMAFLYENIDIKKSQNFILALKYYGYNLEDENFLKLKNLLKSFEN